MTDQAKKDPPCSVPGGKLHSAWLKRLLILLLFFIPAGAAIFYTVGPVLLERIILNKMRTAGFEDPRTKVISITPKGIHLSHVSARTPRLDIDLLTITYGLRSLIQGRVDDVFVSGLQYRIVFEENKPDFGFPVSGAVSGANDPPTRFELPFNTVTVSASSLVMVYDGRNYIVPFCLNMANHDNGILDLSFRPIVPGLPVTVQGRINIHTMETEINANVALSGIFEPNAGHPQPESTPEDLQHLNDARGTIEILAAAEKLGASLSEHSAGIEQAYLHVNALLNDNLQLTNLETDFRAAGLRFGNFYAEKIELKDGNDSGFLFSAAINHPVVGYIEISGDQALFGQLPNDDFSYEARFDLDVRADKIPDGWDRSVPMGIIVKGPASVAAQGTGRVNFAPEGRKSSAGNRHIDMDIQSVVLNAAELLIPGYFAAFTDLALSGSGILHAGPDQISATIREESVFSAARVTHEPPGSSYRISGLELKPEAAFTRSGDGSARVSGFGRTKSKFEADIDDVSVLADSFSLEWNLDLDSNGGLAGVVRALSGIRQIHIPAADALVSDITFDIPISLGGVFTQEGRFSTGAIVQGKNTWPGMTGRTAVNNNHFQAAGSWPFLPGAALEFSCEATTDPAEGVSGGITARTGWFNLPEKALLDRLAPGLEGMNISGSVNTAFSLDLINPALTPEVQVRFKDVALGYPGMELEISGARGNITLNSFSPLTTPGNQRIDISRLMIGDNKFLDGFAIFRLESADAIFLEKSGWNLPEGGFITAHSSRFDMERMSAEFEIFFEDIDIIKIVARVSEGKIDGSGIVYGRVPVLYDHDRITIGDGFLYSVPGTGSLGIKDEEWLKTLLLYVHEAMRGHPYLSTVSERLEQALRNFEYNYLTVNLERRVHDTSARIELRGRGVEGDPPQEVGSLVINVNDLDEIINRTLRFQRSREESIEKALDALFDF